MNKKNFGVVIVIAVLVILAAGGIYMKFYSPQSFGINPDYPINMYLIPGAEAKTSIKITNNEDELHSFQININDLEETVSIDEKEFNLQPKETKEIQITIKDTRNYSHVYFRNLIITNTNFKKEIPVLLTFEDPAHLFAIIQKIIPKYANIYPGGKLGVEIKIFDLGIKTYAKEVRATYGILSPEKTIFYSEENLVINKEYGFSKIFDINKDLPYGNYVLVTSLEYNGIKSVSSYLFEIEAKQNEFFSKNFNIFIPVIFVFIVLVIILFFYFMKSRDELLLQLRRQQASELRRNIQLIIESKKILPEVKKERLEKAWQIFKKNKEKLQEYFFKRI